jgi:hypothetical protein
MRHLRSWGAAYILTALFLGSLVGQIVAMQPKIAEEGQAEFWSAVFENWQSEWLQLLVQAILLSALPHWFFRRSQEQADRMERKLDRLAAIVEPPKRG